MTIHRFFVPAIKFEDSIMSLGADIAWQISKVLRLGSGDKIIVFDGSGVDYLASLEEISPTSVLIRKIEAHVNNTESKLKIALYQSLINKSKFEEVLEKGTEMGVSSFIPIQTVRSQFGIKDIGKEKLNRWNRIIKEAAEQSNRSILPILDQGMEFKDAISNSSSYDLSIIAWENEKENTLTGLKITNNDKRIAIYIGPEGGFSKEEIEFAAPKGVKIVSLGSRILRSETAPLFLIPILLYKFEK